MGVVPDLVGAPAHPHHCELDIFIFARNVLASTPALSGRAAAMGKFLLPGLGSVALLALVAWMWGQRRFAHQFLQGRTMLKVAAANLLHRTVAVGTGLNLARQLMSIARA